MIELCPVGALTSTSVPVRRTPLGDPERARPSAGCARSAATSAATTREGRVKRILSRNHPEVDGGWLCDKGRFAYGHLAASDRDRRSAEARAAAVHGAGLGRRDRRGGAPARRREGTDRHGPLRLRDDRAGVRAREDRPAGARLALRRDARGGLRRARQRAGAALVDRECGPRRDPRRRAGRRAGADRGSLGQARAAERRRGAVRARRGAGARRRAAGADLVRRGRRAATRSRTLASRSAAPGSILPRTANGRGVADAWAASGDAEPVNPEPIGLLIISGDEAAADPYVRAMAERAEAVLAITMFRRPVTPGSPTWSSPGRATSSATAPTSTSKAACSGSGARRSRRRRTSSPCWPGSRSSSASSSRPYPSLVFDEVSAIAYGGRPYGEVGEQAELPQPVPASQVPGDSHPGRGPARQGTGRNCRLVRYRPLFSGPAVERVAEAPVPAARRRGRARPRRRRAPRRSSTARR